MIHKFIKGFFQGFRGECNNKQNSIEEIIEVIDNSNINEQKVIIVPTTQISKKQSLLERNDIKTIIKEIDKEYVKNKSFNTIYKAHKTLLEEVEEELSKTNVVTYIKNTTIMANFIFGLSQSDILRINNKDYEVTKLFNGMCGCYTKCIEFLAKNNFQCHNFNSNVVIFNKIPTTK